MRVRNGLVSKLTPMEREPVPLSCNRNRRLPGSICIQVSFRLMVATTDSTYLGSLRIPWHIAASCQSTGNASHRCVDHLVKFTLREETNRFPVRHPFCAENGTDMGLKHVRIGRIRRHGRSAIHLSNNWDRFQLDYLRTVQVRSVKTPGLLMARSLFETVPQKPGSLSIHSYVVMVDPPASKNEEDDR